MMTRFRVLQLIGSVLFSGAMGCASILDIDEARCHKSFKDCPGFKEDETKDAMADPSSEDSGTNTESPVIALCAEYCSALEASCDTEKLRQYLSEEACNTVCLTYLEPASASSKADDNTLECRLREASAAAVAERETGCVAAGLSGGDACGDICEVYCELVEFRCAPQYEDVFGGDSELCEAECAVLPASEEPFNVGIIKGNTLECRFYHLQAAAVGSDTHCEHVVGLAECVD